MEESNKVRVKNEPIWDIQSIPETRETKRHSYKIKKEPIDKEIQTSKSSKEEAVSIGFWNEETSLENNQVTTINCQTNKPNSK